MRLFVLAAVVLAAGALVLTGPVRVANAGDFVDENAYDFDCDSIRDSVVGHGYETVNGHNNAGSVTVQLSSAGTVTITQDTANVPGAVEAGDNFGFSHASYDRNKDGCDDLVVGAPGESVGSITSAGAVWILPGSSTGFATEQAKVYTQDSYGMPGQAEVDDEFGSDLSAGTTSGGTPYLLIGTSGEDINSIPDAGIVYYVRPEGVMVLNQDTPGVAGKPDYGDRFGSELAISNRYFTIGAPRKQVNGNAVGMVHVFSHTLVDGHPKAIASITQDTPGVSGVAEHIDAFGGAVSILPYRPSGSSSAGALVAVGSPGETIGNAQYAGMAHLLYVSPTGAVNQILAVSQATSGVTGTPEELDQFGWQTVLANLNPENTVATPETAVWEVSVPSEAVPTPGDVHSGAAHVFRPGWKPGDTDIWLHAGKFGLASDGWYGFSFVRATVGALHIASVTPDQCTWVPWSNILNGDTQQVMVFPDDCGYRSFS